MPDDAARSVLVVDDDPVIRALLRDTLEIEGYEVRTAEDGAVGLALVAERRPDCVVLDLMMPGIDGHEVLRRIRAADDDMLPVVMLTAAADDEHTWQAWAGGVSCFLAKPFDVDVLVQWVDYLCSWSGDEDVPAPSLPLV
jgi:DNA-binding response OmpR family regulator